jgi:hypothetical protein
LVGSTRAAKKAAWRAKPAAKPRTPSASSTAAAAPSARPPPPRSGPCRWSSWKAWPTPCPTSRARTTWPPSWLPTPEPPGAPARTQPLFHAHHLHRAAGDRRTLPLAGKALQVKLNRASDLGRQVQSQRCRCGSSQVNSRLLIDAAQRAWRQLITGLPPVPPGVPARTNHSAACRHQDSMSTEPRTSCSQ